MSVPLLALFFTLELLHFMAGARLEASLRQLGDALDLHLDASLPEAVDRPQVGVHPGEVLREDLACRAAEELGRGHHQQLLVGRVVVEVPGDLLDIEGVRSGEVKGGSRDFGSGAG